MRLLQHSGESGIRTHEGLHPTAFRERHFRPLRHLSRAEYSISRCYLASTIKASFSFSIGGNECTRSLAGMRLHCIGQPFMRNGVRTLAAHSQLSAVVTSKESQKKVPRRVIGIWFFAVQGRVCQVMLQGKELSYACVET